MSLCRAIVSISIRPLPVCRVSLSLNLFCLLACLLVCLSSSVSCFIFSVVSHVIVCHCSLIFDTRLLHMERERYNILLQFWYQFFSSLFSVECWHCPVETLCWGEFSWVVAVCHDREPLCSGRITWLPIWQTGLFIASYLLFVCHPSSLLPHTSHIPPVSLPPLLSHPVSFSSSIVMSSVLPSSFFCPLSILPPCLPQMIPPSFPPPFLSSLSSTLLPCSFTYSLKPSLSKFLPGWLSLSIRLLIDLPFYLAVWF